MTLPDPPTGPVTPVTYSLAAVVRLTGVDRDTLVEYCEGGLIPQPTGELEAAEFDDGVLRRIRWIEWLRAEQGVSLAGIRLILALHEEVEQLRRELRFLRQV